MKDHDKIREVAHELAKNLSRGIHTYGPCVNGLKGCAASRGSGKCKVCLTKELTDLVGEKKARGYVIGRVSLEKAHHESINSYDELFNP